MSKKLKGKFVIKFPWEEIEKNEFFLDSFEEARDFAKSKKPSGIVYSPNMIAVGVSLNSNWITIH